MIDELARIISHIDDGVEFDDATEHAQGVYRDIALAVLRRLREPTPEMFTKGQAVIFRHVNCEDVFRAMIDAAMEQAR